MQRRSRVFRLLGLLGMVVQLVLPATLAIADAALQRDSGASAVHIEDHSSAACHVVHGDDCTLCRTLSQLSAPRTLAPCVPIGSFDSRLSIATEIAGRAVDPWFGPPPSRAPPA